MEELPLPSSLGDYEPQFPPELDPAPSRNALLERPAVKAGDLCVGCIVWLPARSSEKKNIKCCKKDCCTNAELDGTGYDHPVIVIKIRQRKNSTVRGDLICYVACITTFSDTNLTTYLSKRPRNTYFQNSMPIHHAQHVHHAQHDMTFHPVENPPAFLLRLQKGSLRKQSYIRLEHIYKVPSHQLRTYGFRNCRAYKMRLAPTSYTLLMEEMGLRNEPYEDTMTLYETAKIRLDALAHTGTPMEDRIRESHAYFSLPLSSESGPGTATGQGERLPSATLERTILPPQPRSTMSYISIPGGGRSRSSSRASAMSRNAVLVNMNYGSIQGALPSGIPSSSFATSIEGEAAGNGGDGNGGCGDSASQITLLPTSIVSPTPYYLPPPTPHTAHYHSYPEFKDERWNKAVVRVLALALAIGVVVVMWMRLEFS